MIQAADTTNTIEMAAEKNRPRKQAGRRIGEIDPRSAAFQFVNAHQASLQVNVASQNALKLRTPGAAKAEAAAEAQRAEAARADKPDRAGPSPRSDVRSSSAQPQATTNTVRPESAPGTAAGRSRVAAAKKSAPRDSAESVAQAGPQRGAVAAQRQTPIVAVAGAVNPAAPRSTTANASGQSAGAIGGVRGPSLRADALAKLVEKSVPARRAVAQREVEQSAMKAMNLALKEGGGDATLRLAPESLGSLKVELSVRDAHVRATFRATTDVARDLLIESTPTLRDALEARGLTVDEVVVEGPRTDARPVNSPAPGHDAQANGHDRSRATAEPARAGETAGGGAGDAGGGAHGQSGRHGAEDRGGPATGDGAALEADASGVAVALGERVGDGFDWLA
jgi:flagellar hook-length control protein FliK